MPAFTPINETSDNASNSPMDVSLNDPSHNARQQNDEAVLRRDTPHSEVRDSNNRPRRFLPPAPEIEIPADFPELTRVHANTTPAIEELSAPDIRTTRRWEDLLQAAADALDVPLPDDSAAEQNIHSYDHTPEELNAYRDAYEHERQRLRGNRRAPRPEYCEPTRIPSYLADLACTPSAPRRVLRARRSPVELAHPPPHRMLRYDNDTLILPDTYLDEAPWRASLALQLLNPYQLEHVQRIIPCDLLLAIENGNLESVLEEIACNRAGDVTDAAAVWSCQAYAQHVRALTILVSYSLSNPYEEQEYRGLMSGWEGTRRRAWTGVGRRREQWVAMLREC